MVYEIVVGVDSSSAMLVDRLGLPPMGVANLTTEICVFCLQCLLHFSHVL